MGANRTTFEKLQRDRAKKAKAAAKRDKRMGRVPEGQVVHTPPPTDEPQGDVGEVISAIPEGQEIPADKLLEMVATVHDLYDKEKISFEEFEERKAELLARVMVD